jgi:GTP-binding protein Era
LAELKSELDTLLDRLPDESRELARAVWRGLPADLRRELDLTLGAFFKVLRNNPAASTDLIHLIKRQAEPAVNPLSTVAVVGPVNVGKSTLYNALLAGTSPEAEVSPVPGTTREAQVAEVGLFRLVDTPGADHGANVGEQEKGMAMEAAMQADFLIVVFDATRSVLASDRVLYGQLLALGKPMLVLLNKMDLVPKAHRGKAISSAAGVLGLSREEIHPTSAAQGTGLENLLLEVAAAEPRLLGELGRTLTPLRRKLGWQAIRRAAVASCLVALSPLPVLDLVPLTLLQGSMVLVLARIYDQEIGISRAGELVASFGMGLAARALFQQLSKLGGPPGWVLSASVAGAATIAIGYATMRWFETGRKPSSAEMRQVLREAQGRLVEVINPLGWKRPGKKALKQELGRRMKAVTGELEKDPIPELPKAGDQPLEA